MYSYINFIIYIRLLLSPVPCSSSSKKDLHAKNEEKNNLGNVLEPVTQVETKIISTSCALWLKLYFLSSSDKHYIANIYLSRFQSEICIFLFRWMIYCSLNSQKNLISYKIVSKKVNFRRKTMLLFSMSYLVIMFSWKLKS